MSELVCEIHCCAWAAQLWPCHAQQGEGVQLTAEMQVCWEGNIWAAQVQLVSLPAQV